MERNKRISDGFSLIEVIVAVAILAILSMPILLYFTNSAIHSAHGKHEQEADLAAQSVIEEIDSVDGFNSLEVELPAIDGSWTAFTSPAAYGGSSHLRRDLSVNGREYVADVTVNYGDDIYMGTASDPAPTPVAKYNNYEKPELSELYSEGSVVISEPIIKHEVLFTSGDSVGTEVELSSNVYNLGISDIYYKVNGRSSSTTGQVTFTSPSAEVTMDMIRQHTKRIFEISVKDDPGNPDTMFSVRGGYKFNYCDDFGNVIEKTSVSIKNTRIEKKKLENIYFMFQPVWAFSGDSTHADPEELCYLDLSGLTGSYADHKLNISFIKQQVTDALDVTNTYTIHMKAADGGEFTSIPANVSVFGSGWKDGSSNRGVYLPEIADVTGKDPTLVKREKVNRIAKITVAIYDASTYADGSSPGEPLATVTTSKSE